MWRHIEQRKTRDDERARIVDISLVSSLATDGVAMQICAIRFEENTCASRSVQILRFAHLHTSRSAARRGRARGRSTTKASGRTPSSGSREKPA